jgi:hypothetical protein
VLLTRSDSVSLTRTKPVLLTREKVRVAFSSDPPSPGGSVAIGVAQVTTPMGTAAVVPSKGTAEVVPAMCTAAVVPSKGTAEVVPTCATSTAAVVLALGAAAAVPVPLAGFTQASPPFYFGALPPSPRLGDSVPVVPAPTTAEGCGLPFRSVPDVTAARERWLTQIDRLGALQGADQRLLEEVRTAVVDGVKLDFANGTPPPGSYTNTFSFKMNQKVCLERLRVYEELGALRKLATLPDGAYYVQPLHAVVKAGKKARVCVDLSRNLNDYLPDQPFHYSSVAAGVRLAQECPGQAWFVKLDLSSCFLSFPIHPDDWQYYVCKAGGDYIQFLRMVFGLKSAPRTASLLLDVVSSALTDAGIAHVRYLDDFFLVATTRERVWACAHKAAALIAKFGLALSPEKVEGPAQVLEFLGIVFDSLSETLSISQERKKELLGLLADFDGKGWASRSAVQSLLGKLSFAATVLPGARPFLRRVIDTMRAGHKRIALGANFRADIAYWATHIEKWNGRAKWRVDAADPFVFGSDASTTGFAYGLEACPARALASLPGHLQPGSVRMGCWSACAGHAVKQQTSSEIQWGEFFAPLAAAVEYSKWLEGSHVVFVVDNESDVHVLNRLSTREPRVCALLRSLCDTALRFNFSFSAVHRPGKDNDLMDWASRPARHAFAGDVAAFEPMPAPRTPTLCSCSVVCGVLRHPPLTHPTSLSFINSRCLRFDASDSSTSWRGTCGGW